MNVILLNTIPMSDPGPDHIEICFKASHCLVPLSPGHPTCGVTMRLSAVLPFTLGTLQEAILTHLCCSSVQAKHSFACSSTLATWGSARGASATVQTVRSRRCRHTRANVQTSPERRCRRARATRADGARPTDQTRQSNGADGPQRRCIHTTRATVRRRQM
jgi:hypothetical protein